MKWILLLSILLVGCKTPTITLTYKINPNMDVKINFGENNNGS